MSLEGVQVHYVDSIDAAYEFKRWLGERRPVLGFDTETTGLHWWGPNDAIRLAQFGDAMTGWAIPFERWSGVVEEVFRTYDDPIVGHNVRFDLRFLAHHGIAVDQANVHDTMLAANALWPDQRMALKHLATRRLDAHAADGEAALSEAMAAGKWNWATVPVDLPQYWAYGALDAILSARLHEQMQPLLVEEGVAEVYELECAVSRVLFKMEMRGAAIDVPFCHEKYTQLTRYAQDLRVWCQEQFGCLPGAQDEVVSKLKAAGYEFTKRTAGGRTALDEDVLSRIDHPLAQTVLNVRKSEKIASTYFKNFIALQQDGRLHCSVRQVGAKTGRMSITEPALQTLPRDNKIVRNAFIPIADDHRLVSIDYEQIEMRLLAHFAHEEEMIRRINAGIDMHTAVAQVIYGTEQPTKSQRQVTKNANFAKAYVAGARKFAMTAGITEAEGYAFYAMYDETFPGVKRFQNEVTQVADQRWRHEGKAYVRAPSGRLHVGDPDALYKLVNYLIQGTAADVLKERVVSLDMAGLSDYMVLLVHDEVIFDFPTADVEELTRVASETMTDATNFAVTLAVDASAPMERWEK